MKGDQCLDIDYTHEIHLVYNSRYCIVNEETENPCRGKFDDIYILDPLSEQKQKYHQNQER